MIDQIFGWVPLYTYNPLVSTEILYETFLILPCKYWVSTSFCVSVENLAFMKFEKYTILTCISNGLGDKWFELQTKPQKAP